jgi:hypothetical protein
MLYLVRPHGVDNTVFATTPTKHRKHIILQQKDWYTGHRDANRHFDTLLASTE